MPEIVKRGLRRVGEAVQHSVDRTLSPIRSRNTPDEIPTGIRYESLGQRFSTAGIPAAETTAQRTLMGDALQRGGKRQRATQSLAISYILLHRHQHVTMSAQINKWVDDYLPLDIKHDWLETASNFDLWLFGQATQTMQRPALIPKVNEIFDRYHSLTEYQRGLYCRSISRDLLNIAMKAVKRAGPGITVLEQISDSVDQRAPALDLDSDLDAGDIGLALNRIHVQV
nr:hypothetical protein CFP56_16622 [Quercus suber]